MSPSQITLLGAIAGLTIFLGLPIGRMKAVAPKVKAFLNGTAIGILIFLLWDVLTNAWGPADNGLTSHHYVTAVADGVVMLGCAGAGLLGLVYFDRWIARRARRTAPEGPGAAPARPAPAPAVPPSAATRAAQLSMLIAVGIGMHNFGEGLAIGTSAAAGRLSLAIMLVIGFGAHNATEGFGIVAPLAATGQRPPWARLGLLGLIGGGPTFVGTVVGQQVTSPLLAVAFLALAAGSILYVVIELLAVARSSGFKVIITWAIFLGLLLGFVTDAIVTAAGA
ncbi:MAG TPA: ZIP family metal transporter [Streptosporangiaceae bacterium]|nr:ZIP family metal transporter [Streptosporangiaceae bacterium]